MEPQGMKSSFGNYRGVDEQLYDGAKRTSTYLALADGTRLAYDLFLPTRKGTVAKGRLPTLFKYTPYCRSWTIYDKSGKNNLAELMSLDAVGRAMVRLRVWLKGNVMDALGRTEWLGEMVKSGYAMIVVERPGTGASFGQMSWDPASAMREANEILNWIAAQPWSDGNIGMFGDSIQAQVQFQAAATGNPYLKAILPATTWMDNCSVVMFPGGVLNTAMAEMYVKLNTAFAGDLVTPVDEDPEGVLLAQARAERGGKSKLAETVKKSARESVFRDGWSDTQALYPLLDKINRAGVPAYLINGWYDVYARDNFLIFANLTVPKRLLVRPVDHSGIESPDDDIDYGRRRTADSSIG
jgi:putative CocE/NonD family hydrolase